VQLVVLPPFSSVNRLVAGSNPARGANACSLLFATLSMAVEKTLCDQRYRPMVVHGCLWSSMSSRDASGYGAQLARRTNNEYSARPTSEFATASNRERNGNLVACCRGHVTTPSNEDASSQTSVFADETLKRVEGGKWQSNCLILLEATPGIEPGYTVLQTVA
jgi:hypothetical protein